MNMRTMTAMAAACSACCAKSADATVQPMKTSSMPIVLTLNRGRLPIRSTRVADVRAIRKFQMLRIPLINAWMFLSVIPMVSSIRARSTRGVRKSSQVANGLLTVRDQTIARPLGECAHTNDQEHSISISRSTKHGFPGRVTGCYSDQYCVSQCRESNTHIFQDQWQRISQHIQV